LNELQNNYGIIGQSQAIQQIFQTIALVAPTQISALVIGESGTGKELVAKAIHTESSRSDKPLVIVNCGAIPEGILESELFGHEKGAFTGAVGARKGYFELAHEGAIFLDEIGEMPLATQVKLLRVLETGDFMRVGGVKGQHVDVRVIAATNKDLENEVQMGNFRQDLFYRLNAISIRIPPLKERRQDIHLLVDKMAANFTKENHIEFAGFTNGAYQVLENYDWPGNVRELKNVVESMIILEKGNIIDDQRILKYVKPVSYGPSRNLPVPTNRSSEQVEREFIYHALLDLKNEIVKLREDIYQFMYTDAQPKSLPYYSEVASKNLRDDYTAEVNESASIVDKTLDEVEKLLINRALEKTNGNKRKAAKSLGISERTLYRKINDYELPF